MLPSLSPLIRKSLGRAPVGSRWCHTGGLNGVREDLDLGVDLDRKGDIRFLLIDVVGCLDVPSCLHSQLSAQPALAISVKRKLAIMCFMSDLEKLFLVHVAGGIFVFLNALGSGHYLYWQNVADLQQSKGAKYPRESPNVHQCDRSRVSPRNVQSAFCTGGATRRPHFLLRCCRPGRFCRKNSKRMGVLGRHTAAAGVGYEDIIDTTIYMVELQKITCAMSKAKDEFIKEPYPASSGSVSPNWSFQVPEPRSKSWRVSRNKSGVRRIFKSQSSLFNGGRQQN